jgi:mannose-1-phosphate guanylyltransferase
MSLYDYKYNLKYGVIDTKNSGKVISWNEKPEFSAKINIGCYVMEPEVLQLIPKNKPYGMDSVIRKILSKKMKVGSVISKKGFIDIGDKETYEKTNEEYKKNRYD